VNKFQEAYAAAQTALRTPLSGDLESHRSELAALIADGGPVSSKKESLTRLRARIELGAVMNKASAGSKTAGEARYITDSAGAKDSSGKAKRAAALKMLRHFYHGQSSGGAAIWVYSPPVAYDKWVFDKIAVDTDVDIMSKLNVDLTEVYSKTQRAVMVSAISEARRIASNAALKVETPNATTTALVQQYFTDAGSGDVTEICKTLKAGYSKIAAGLGSSSVVISDEPGDRLGGGWKDWAFIYPSEDMKVIYLQGAWLKKADEATPDNSSPLHRCARTVIHEMSHKECRTEDICYGPKGLKPNGALTGAYALHNADSWAYFAVDVNGLLTGPDASNATKANTAILKTPSKTLTVA
jgi:hypothetical protein